MSDHPIVLFDGVCNLCSRSVRYIISHDRKGRFRFASLQSSAGRKLQARYDFDPDAVNAIVLLEGGKAYSKSDAALRIARKLGGPARYWWIARLLPKPIRDALYDWIGSNRYRWFGKQAECMIPAPHLRERFLDDEAETPSVLR